MFLMLMHVNDSVGQQARLTDAELARAAARWGKFTSALSADDKRVLDRVAAGESLKAVCFELSLGYEAVQKRMTRLQQALDLKSTSVMLHVWATVRGFGTRGDDPTLLRYADMLRRTLGYDAPTRLPPAEATSDDVDFPAGTRGFVLVKSAPVAAREQAERDTLALMSPAVWRICQRYARDRCYDHSQAAGLPALHEWFCQQINPAPGCSGSDRLALILTVFSQQSASRRELLDDDFTLLSAAQRLCATHLDIPPSAALVTSAAASNWTGVSQASDRTFWRDLSGAAYARDEDQLASLWERPTPEQLLDPGYGLAAAVTFFRARTPALRAAVSPALNRLLSARQQWAVVRRIDPLQLLHRHACFECGMSMVETAPATDWACPVLTAEQLLPRVKQLFAYASAGSVNALA